MHKVEVGDSDLHTLLNQLLAETEDTNSHWNSAIDKGVLVEEVIAQGEEMSERLPTLRYIGWDFVYDKDKEWIVMEGNENAEINSPQLIHHRGMREEFEQLIGYKPTKEYWWQGKYPSRFENIK